MVLTEGWVSGATLQMPFSFCPVNVVLGPKEEGGWLDGYLKELRR